MQFDEIYYKQVLIFIKTLAVAPVFARAYARVFLHFNSMLYGGW